MDERPTLSLVALSVEGKAQMRRYLVQRAVRNAALLNRQNVLAVLVRGAAVAVPVGVRRPVVPA